MQKTNNPIKIGQKWGTCVAQPVKHLPSAQVMIPGSWDLVLHQASLLSKESASPSPLLLFSLSLSLSLSCSQVNKILKTTTEVPGWHSG